MHQVSVLDLILNTGSALPGSIFDLLTMDLSIVTSLYYSAPYLEEFYRRSCASAEKIARDFEFVLVNDGSPDHSLAVAIALHEKDSRACNRPVPQFWASQSDYDGIDARTGRPGLYARL